MLLAPTSIAATPADTAATHAYLQAGLQLTQAFVQNVAASRSAVTSQADQLGRECHGVLAGAPKEEFGPPSESTATPRTRGERQRSELQQDTIDEELIYTVETAIYQPDRVAAQAFAAEIAPLSWSDPRIAPLTHLELDRLQELLSPPVPNVCAEMKAWAQSGYHLLSTASREFAAAQMARAGAGTPEGSLHPLLKPYEGPRERALIRRTRALALRFATALAGISHAFASLQRALGVPENPFEEREHEPVLGRGTTQAGSTFVVRRETPRGSLDRSCRHSVSVELEEGSKTSGAFSVSSSSAHSVCLSGHANSQPSSSCGSGIESITAAVPASVRTVTMRLSDGSTITSRVVRIPSRDDGPGRVYVQAIRGYRPYPVSLTELDRNGNVVLVVKLKAHRCRREPASKGPSFVDLAKGTTPGGQPFTIQGVIFHFGKHTDFSLTLASGLDVNREDSSILTGAKPRAFSWSLGLECPPHEFAIIYGILSPPGDSVLARTPEGLVPLTQVPIAANLHSNGPLVYGVFSTLPSELIVRRSDGSTLYSESLAVRAKEEAEFCQGYAEG